MFNINQDGKNVQRRGTNRNMCVNIEKSIAKTLVRYLDVFKKG